MRISVVIPVYNEENVIVSCLQSLDNQSEQNLEVIVVDDGSKDGTEAAVKSCRLENFRLTVLQQTHQGPGAARNFGAGKAAGDILVFVDADMEFAPEFLEKLTEPIKAGRTIGTYAKDEYLLNKDKPLARSWNLNLGRSPERMEPGDFQKGGNSLVRRLKNFYKRLEGPGPEEVREENSQHVFRAILKSQFDKAGGFAADVGYTDDWSLSRKLGSLALAAPGAVFYHRNPERLPEVWRQARWFGKNEFLTRNFLRRIYNLWRYCPVLAPVKGLFGAIYYREPAFLPFKIVYDTAVFVSVIRSFWGEAKYK